MREYIASKSAGHHLESFVDERADRPKGVGCRNPVITAAHLKSLNLSRRLMNHLNELKERAFIRGPLSAKMGLLSGQEILWEVNGEQHPVRLFSPKNHLESVGMPIAAHRAQVSSVFEIAGGDVAGLLSRFADPRRKARARTEQHFPLFLIQEAGLDDFWIHRVLEAEGIESHVVDPASIAVSRRKRRVKTDRVDGKMLMRAQLAYTRGTSGVCNGESTNP